MANWKIIIIIPLAIIIVLLAAGFIYYQLAVKQDTASLFNGLLRPDQTSASPSPDNKTRY